MSYPFGLDTPLVALSKRDAITIRDANRGVLCLGSPGSGKTSTTYKALLTAYLRAGMGGLITTAKPGDVDKVRQIARACGREKSLVIINERSQWRFNFIRYVMATSPDPGALLLNLVAYLSNIIETMSGRISAGGGENQFWTKSTKEALLNTASLLWAAYGHVTLYDIFAVLHSRPMSRDEANTSKWRRGSFMSATLEQAKAGAVEPMHSMDYRVVDNYLTNTLANPDSRTTGNIIATISADLAPLLQGQMREMFNTGLNITPEHAIEGGAIIVLDFPVEVYGEVGVLAQQIFKYAFQKAVLRRRIDRKTRNTFLLVDEAALFLSPYDAEFLSLARESQCATTFCVQNLPSIYARIGGQNPQHTADQLIGNFSNFVFHANGDFRTNEAAANMIGKGVQLLYNMSVGLNAGRGVSAQNGISVTKSMPGSPTSTTDNSSITRSFNIGQNVNRGVTEQMDYDIQPSAFTRLRTGGKPNKYLVDAIVFRPGNLFQHSGRTWMPVVFDQRK